MILTCFWMSGQVLKFSLFHQQYLKVASVVSHLYKWWVLLCLANICDKLFDSCDRKHDFSCICNCICNLYFLYLQLYSQVVYTTVTSSICLHLSGLEVEYWAQHPRVKCATPAKVLWWRHFWFFGSFGILPNDQCNHDYGHVSPQLSGLTVN